MAPVSPIENNGPYTKAVKHLVALVYLLAPVTYWGYSITTGKPVDMMVWILVITFALASAYVVFGQKQVNEALDQAQQMTGQETDADTKQSK